MSLLAAAMFALALAACGQTIPNPNFNANGFFSVLPGYASGNGGVITGWTLSDASYIGLNPVFHISTFSSPFADNGAIPVGPNVAFIQSANNTNTLSTTITGLTVGQSYVVNFRANCRAATGAPNPTWSLNGGGFTAFTAAPAVGGSNPYYTNAGYFTASATTAALALRNNTTVDSSVLLDGFSIGLVSLGTTNLLVGPANGTNSVELAISSPTLTWTASTGVSWLHLSVANQTGTGGAVVIFTFDANPGATRAGTLTVAGLTVNVTQAGASYVAANTLATLNIYGVPDAFGVAVDGAGNAYVTTYGFQAIEKWTATNGALSTMFPFFSQDVALDGAGNIYAQHNTEIVEWTATNGILSNLFSDTNLTYSLAADRSGNVYVAYADTGILVKWTAATGVLTTVVSNGLEFPSGVAVDLAGNIYIADTGHNVIKKWTAANSNLTTLVSSGLTSPWALSVDGSGDVYIADTGDDAIKKWTAANGSLTTLVSGLINYPYGATVDGAGNVYFTDFNVLKELPYAFVDPSAKAEPAAAGSDALPVVLPACANLLAPQLAPTTDSDWLTIGSVSNGVVSFSFTPNFTTNNSASNRLGHINVLGVSVPVSQSFTIITPPTLTPSTVTGNGLVQFAFTNNPNATFTVLMSTNLALPLSNWTVLGAATNIGAGIFQFTDQTTNNAQRFYTVRAP